MHLVTKIIRGKPRNYLCESYRDKKTGKPKKRHVVYLGQCRTVYERVAMLRRELAIAKRELTELQESIEPALKELRSTGNCPSPDEIENMNVAWRRITFFLPGTYEASKSLKPLRKHISRLEGSIRKLTSKFPNLR